VGAAYEALLRADPDRWRRIDARRSPEEVHQLVMASVKAARE
jgi:thymidylate kinase